MSTVLPLIVQGKFRKHSKIWWPTSIYQQKGLKHLSLEAYQQRLRYIRAFDKLPSSKTGKEKRATSPKIKQFMPKISEIALYNEKRTDIFGINPVVS